MGIVRRGLLASAIAGLLASSAASFAAPRDTEPPASGLADAPATARTVDVADHAFGLTLPDPYRWMEGQNNKEFDAWIKAQGEYARARLDSLPTQAAWRKRLQDAGKASVYVDSFRRANGKVFYLRYSGKSTGTLMVRDARGRQRVLFDPAGPNGGNGQSAIQSFAPSPDGRLVAIDLGLGTGMEVSRIKVLDTETLQWLPDVVEPVWGEFAANWLPDGSGFAYTQIAPKEAP